MPVRKSIKRTPTVVGVLFLFHVGVVGDVVHAVAVVAVAAGAVPKFQFWIGHVCTTANCAAVGVRGLLWRLLLPVKGDWSVLFGRLGSPNPSVATGSPCGRQNIDNTFAHKQEEGSNAYQREQIGGEGKTCLRKVCYIDYHHSQINQRHDPCLDRNDEENQKLVCLVEMFGRESEVELAFNQVRVANN